MNNTWRFIGEIKKTNQFHIHSPKPVKHTVKPRWALQCVSPQSLEPREEKLDLSPGQKDRNRWSHEQNHNNKITAYKLHRQKIWYISHIEYMWGVDPGDDWAGRGINTTSPPPRDQHQANHMLWWGWTDVKRMRPFTTQRISADATPVKRHMSRSWISCFDATLKTKIKLMKF